MGQKLVIVWTAPTRIFHPSLQYKMSHLYIFILFMVETHCYKRATASLPYYMEDSSKGIKRNYMHCNSKPYGAIIQGHRVFLLQLKQELLDSDNSAKNFYGVYIGFFRIFRHVYTSYTLCAEPF